MELKRRNLFGIFGVILVILVIHFFYSISKPNPSKPSINHFKIMQEDDYSSKHTSEKVKYIALWTPFFTVKNWGFNNETVGKEWLQSINCPRTDCVFTNNKKLLDQPHLYDAIVFHGSENWKLLQLPKSRRTSQLYVMATME